MSEMIGLDAIKKGAQARARMKKEAIEDYARAMREGAQFPPIVVFRDGKDYWLADGFHRVEAARCAEREEIEADIQEGNRRDALLYACGANTVHGLPRTNADKRKAVTLLLQDEAWHELPSREIARHCCVDEGLVRKIREELSADCPQINPETRVVTRGGTTYKQRKPSKSKDVTAQPEAERPLPSEPATPTVAEHDGFAALQTAWQGANQDGRRRFGQSHRGSAAA